MKCPYCQSEVQPGQKFCMTCGKELDLKKKKGLGKDIRKYLTVALVLAASIAVVYLVYQVLFGGLFASSSDKIVYGVRKNENQDTYETIYSVDMNGKNRRELYEDAPAKISWLSNYQKFFTSDGAFLQFYDEGEEELVILDTKDGNVETYLPTGDEILWSTFTDDDKKLLIHEEDDDDLIMKILNDQAQEINAYFDYLSVEMMPNKKDILVYKMDYDEFDNPFVDELGIINLESGDYSFIASINEEDNVGPVKVSKNGKKVFYQDRDELISLDIGSAEISTVFEAEEDAYIDLDLSDSDKQAILLEYGENDTLYSVAIRDRTSVRIDRYVVQAFFTPDNKHIIYSTDEGLDMYDLYCVGIDGSDKVRLGKDITNLVFQVSPNGKYVAYIDNRSSTKGGDLMIVDVTGENLTQFDTDVWSFQFTDDSRMVIYSRVEDLDRGRPESEIYKNKINGQTKEKIIELDDGLYEILWPCPDVDY